MAASGLTRATTLAAASRGEIELAISRGVVPEGTSRTEPSGSWIEIVDLLIMKKVLSEWWRDANCAG